jgi:hypothetical protein
MPHLDFELKALALTFVGQRDSDEWQVSLDGVCKRRFGNSRFILRSGGKSCNGFEGVALVHIRERLSRTELLGALVNPSLDDIGEESDSIHVTFPEVETERPSFDISISLPPDAYRRVIDMDWSTSYLMLSVENGSFGEALFYGGDPDGSLVEWDLDRASHVFIKGIRLRFLPRNELRAKSGVDESEDDQKNSELSAIFAPMVGAIERLTVAFDKLRGSIFWAVMLVVVIAVVSQLSM